MLKETQPYGVAHPSKEVPSIGLPQVNHPNFAGSIGQPHGDGYPAYPVPASAMPQPTFPNGYLTQGVPATIVPQPVKYDQKTARRLGISQIIIGIICIVLNCVAFLGFTLFTVIGSGLWGGILFIITGVLSVLSGKKLPNQCLIIGTMVMSIISACASAVALSCGVAMTAQAYFIGYIVIGSLLAISAFIEAILAIFTSMNCCKVVCCGRSQMAGAPINVMVYQPAIPYPINSSHPNAPMSSESFPGFTNSPSGACFPISSNNLGFGNNNPPRYNNCGNTGTNNGGFSVAD